LPNGHTFPLSHGRSFETASITSTATSFSQSKPVYTDGESPYSSISSKVDHGPFDYMDEVQGGSSPIPFIKVMGENHRPRTNYRAELIQSVLTLLCTYYRLCRPITLQVL
jgi:hypothetical protein